MRPTTVTKAKLMAITAKLPVFRNLAPFEKELLVDHSQLFVAEEGDTIIEKSAEDYCIYILLSGGGSVHLQKDGDAIGEINPGEMFGEIGFALNVPRNTWVFATATCILFRIDQELMSHLGSSIREKIKDEVIMKMAVTIQQMNSKLS